MDSEEKPRWLIRLMRAEDIERCLEIWSRVELTEARSTVASNLATDPEGFYVAELIDQSSNGQAKRHSGKVIGMCAGTMTRRDTAFIGFYGVEPEFQGIGIGRQLWDRCLSRLSESLNVGLYGVSSMTEKYMKAGFKLEDSIRMVIYESEPNGEHKLRLGSLKSFDQFKGEAEGNFELAIIDNGAANGQRILNKLIEYDQLVHGYSRDKLLNNYLAGSDIPLTVAIVEHCKRQCSSDQQDSLQQRHQSSGGAAIVERKSSCCAKPSENDIIEDETLCTSIKSSLSISASNIGVLQPRAASPVDISSVYTPQNSSPSAPTTTSGPDEIKIRGYGCIRDDNNSGGIIGPIYADSDEICQVILRSLLERFKLKASKIYSAMALDSNEQACALMANLGLTRIDECTRMFTNFIPSATFSKIYYVHSPNFTLF